MPYGTSSVDNVVLGAALVTFGATDLGYTQGGIDVEIKTETRKIMVDQFGATEVNEYIMGTGCTVKVPLAETDLAKMLIAMPGATIVGTATKKLNVPHRQGTSLRSFAQQLVLHPKALSLGDKSQDFTVPIAAAKSNINFSFKHDAERVYNVEFSGYPDLTTGLLYVMGDPAAS